MNYIASYQQWLAVFEETGQVGIKLKELEFNLIELLKKKGTSVEDLKKNLGSFQPVEFSDEPIELEEPVALQEARALHESTDWEYWIDLTIDIISGILEGLPGLGTLASGAVDALHTISYVIRYFFASDEKSKITYLVLAGIGTAAAFMPLAGNLLNISARAGIASALKVAPDKIYRALYKLKGKKLPLSHWSNLAKWKLNFLYVLMKTLGNFGQDLLAKIANAFNSMSKKILAGLRSWADSSPLTGWIARDYAIPAISKVASYFEGLGGVTGLKELAV